MQSLSQWFSTFFELGPIFVFKKISGPTRTTTCRKYLLLIRHYTAYYMIGIIKAQSLVNIVAILSHIVNVSSALHAGCISV